MIILFAILGDYHTLRGRIVNDNFQCFETINMAIHILKDILKEDEKVK